MLRWLATLAVIAHSLVAYLHGQAHKDLGVGLNEWQTWFVRIVILAAPWVAVTGGTGTFTGARGEAKIITIDRNSEMITITLTT